MSNQVASAEFDIDLAPAAADLPTTGRFDFTKTWRGAVEGVSRGFMASAGDPADGEAGYVALEEFEGAIDGRRGKLVFQQLGSMHAGEQELRYAVVPGSGTGELTGIAGEIELNREDGKHLVELSYSLPD